MAVAPLTEKHINIFSDLQEICKQDTLQLPIVVSNRNNFKVEDSRFPFFQSQLIATIQNGLKEALDTSTYFILNFKDTEVGWITYCLTRKTGGADILMLIPCSFDGTGWKTVALDTYPIQQEIDQHMSALEISVGQYKDNQEILTEQLFINLSSIYDALVKIKAANLSQLYFYYTYFFLASDEFKANTGIYNDDYPKLAWENIKHQTEILSTRMNEIASKAQVVKAGEKVARGAQDIASELQQRFVQDKNRLPEHVKNIWEKEFKKLTYTHPNLPDYAKSIEFLEIILDIPFGKYSANNISVKELQAKLIESHYGLQEAKRAIVEHIALQKFANKTHGEVICLVGPPGTGKSSLANIVANTLDRRFIKIALGGLPDEAEFRGHRKTYVGAAQGRLVDGYINCGTMDPVVVFDEVDKLVAFRGSPADALLEILDPEQNDHFVDRYLSFPIDISRSMFICTANYIDQIPDPLKDRMYIINVEGYTYDEQFIITKDYIIPKYAKKFHMENIVIISEDLVKDLCVQKRSGMRDAERAIRSIYKKSAYALLSEGLDRLELTAENCKKLIEYEHVTRNSKKSAGF